MAFVKLDQGILNSTIWVQRPDLEIFITALLIAEPVEFLSPVPTIKIRTLEDAGFVVPPGWYGFCSAAGPGIVHRAHIDPEIGLAALERLASPEQGSRSQAFEGRRLVRVDGGFVVLNFMRYRDRDHTAAERQRRLRARKKHQQDVTRDGNGVTRDETPMSRDSNVTSRIAENRVQSTDPIHQSPNGGEKSDLQKRAEKLFRRKETTAWDPTEKKAWKAALEAIESTPEDEWLLLEQFYGRPASEPTYRRRDLATLLNNWRAEIDRARDYLAKTGGSLFAGSPVRIPKPARAMEGERAYGLNER